jgi:hypothetical protein
MLKLKPSQILASEWALLLPEKLQMVAGKAFPHQPERQMQTIEALHFYDAFLGVTDAAIHHIFTPKALLEFRGFLAAEVDLPTADALRIVWLVGDWFVRNGFINEQDVQFFLSQDQAFVQRLYLESAPIPDRIKYYSEWFVIRGGSFAINLSYLDSILSEQSQRFLRDRLADYLKDKDAYQARTDVELIYSLLMGYVAKWPARELSATLSKKETVIFLEEIKAETDRQMFFAGLTNVEAKENRKLVMNVVRHFFMRNGIFVSVSKV